MIGPWTYALLTLAAFSFWKLVGDDRILDRPRDWALGRMQDKDRQTYWGDFLVCPWCAGFWVSLAVYASFLIGPGDWPGAFWAVITLFAIRAGVGVLGTAYYAVTGEYD